MGARARLAEAALGISTVAAIPAGGGVDGIPPRALVAYLAAAETAPCKVPWNVLAAIGAVEAGHGTHGGATLDNDGRMTVMAVSHAQAMGPMQFIGPTWDQYGQGDINDIDDAAPAAARLLCANGYEQDPTNAIGQYNGGAEWPRWAESREYVVKVDEYAHAYAKADPRTVEPKPKERSPQRLWDSIVARWMWLGDVAEVAGVGPVWRWVDDALFGAEAGVQRAVAAARPDRLNPTFGANLDRFIAGAPGEITVVSGFRSAEEQMAERRENCPDALLSDSTECSPWTAKPGTSDHERGLAADLAYQDEATERWAHANAARYGLQYDVEPEPWHISLAR